MTTQLKRTFRRGGQIGNTNTAKHGLRMRGDRLPKGCAGIRLRLDTLREQLEAEIKLRHSGLISVYHSALVQSCVRHEQRCQLLQRWLRLEGGDLEISDRAQLLRDLGTATTARDKCLEQLGLNREFKANTAGDGDSGLQPGTLEGRTVRPPAR